MDSRKKRKFLSSLTFGAYITILVEVYLLIMIVILSEMAQNDTDSKATRESLDATYVIVTCITVFMALLIWQWIKATKADNYEKMKYFKSIFESYKNNKWARLFIFIFLIKRTLF